MFTIGTVIPQTYSTLPQCQHRKTLAMLTYAVLHEILHEWIQPQIHPKSEIRLPLAKFSGYNPLGFLQAREIFQIKKLPFI